MLKSNGLRHSKNPPVRFSFSPKTVPVNIAKKLPPQRCSKPIFIALFNFSHKWTTFAFTSESGYTLGSAQRIAHKGLHGETGAFQMGGAITTLGAFRRFTNIPGPGIRTANFAAFGSWSETLPKNTESLRDSDALMRVAVPKASRPRWAACSCRYCVNDKKYDQSVGWFIFDFLLGKCKFYQKGCFTALLIRRNRWLPIFQPHLVDFWRAFW